MCCLCLFFQVWTRKIHFPLLKMIKSICTHTNDIKLNYTFYYLLSLFLLPKYVFFYNFTIQVFNFFTFYQWWHVTKFFFAKRCHFVTNLMMKYAKIKNFGGKIRNKQIWIVKCTRIENLSDNFCGKSLDDKICKIMIVGWQNVHLSKN